jgi:CheY-like chemotaxis protein
MDKMKEREKAFDILLVEDNEDDVIIIKRVFKKIRLVNNLHIVRDGQEALDFIFRQGKYEEQDVPVPGLVLLDISMPIKDGFQVLKEIKANPNTRRIPVVMLTTSMRDEDIVKSYEYGACSFITKPVDFNEFVKAIERFDIYWSLVAKLPEK